MSQFESSIQTRIAERAKRQYGKRIVVRVKHGTLFAVVGDPDIYGCLDGMYFAFEVKNEEGKITTIQRHRLREVTLAGGNAAAVRSADGALTLLCEWSSIWPRRKT